MKTKTIFSCQNCGHQSPKWLGKCPDCGSWNSFAEEEFSEPAARVNQRLSPYSQAPVLLKEVEAGEEERMKTGITELDRVLGSGIVAGSVVLIGGDPGIGKSTISMQISGRLSKQGRTVLYCSGEESGAQTKLRARRIGAEKEDNLYIVNQTDLSLIVEHIKTLKPEVVFIDSIQVLFDPRISSSPGSVSQVRECAGTLTQIAKSCGIALFIIGHVTKEGSIAGPRVLEHIVDTVLYFEGDRFSSYRILRAVKNRFGSTNEIGIFEMGAQGLEEVKNPSQIFLSERPKDVSGVAVTAVLEGSRPLLVEVQSLVTKASFGYPSRRAQGFDYNRLILLVAVLEKRIGLHLGLEDVFVNVAGGIHIEDPAADLAVAAAIFSAFRDRQVDAGTALIGEIGLAGEIRGVPQMELRINEAAKLGFKHCVVPATSLKNQSHLKRAGLEMAAASTLKEALDIIIRR